MSLTPAEPRFVPRYTGYCPQEKFRCGETYGNVTHKLLLDPRVNHATTLILSNRATDDFEVCRESGSVQKSRDDRRARPEPIYLDPMIPGYEGFMPNLKARSGQRYRVLAREALTEFQLQEERRKAALNLLRRRIDLQSGRGEPRSIEDRLLVETEQKFPALIVRPDCVDLAGSVTVEEPYETPRRHGPSSYVMDHPGKHRVSGYTGHVPYGFGHFGKSNQPLTEDAHQDFIANYRATLNSEWAPISISRPDPPFHSLQPTEIYHKHIGLLPNYLGHVPGATFRFGKTFGADTKDAKRFLRGDTS